MITKERISKIAQKLGSMVPETDLQNIFVICSELFKKQNTYFSNFEQHDLIKLVIYVYLMKNDRQSEADYIFENLFFAGLFMPTGERAEDECNHCGGSGESRCGSCDGDGNVECDTCEGSGTVTCDGCRGTGIVDGESCVICDGDGEINCAYCDEGKQTCDNCNGTQNETCDECNGYGMVDTYRNVFIIDNVVSWDKDFRDRCELTINTFEPTLSEKSFKEIQNLLVISQEEDSYEFSWDFDQDKFYCFAMDDSPKFLKFRGFRAFDIHQMDFYKD